MFQFVSQRLFFCVLILCYVTVSTCKSTHNSNSNSVSRIRNGISKLFNHNDRKDRKDRKDSSSTIIGNSVSASGDYDHKIEVITAITQGTFSLLIAICNAYATKVILQTLLRSIDSITSNILKQMHSSTASSSALSNHNITRFLQANVTLDAYELEILTTAVIDPDSISTTLADVAGLNDVKASIVTCIASPNSSKGSDIDGDMLYKPTSSILLYGPPGCGKTHIVKGIGKQLNYPIINITPSLLLRKYVGETSLLTKAIFTLANKFNTSCIIFIDEMDSLFKLRDMDRENTVERNLKTEFMVLLDTIISSGNSGSSNVLVVGCTNRPQDIDTAVTRRFERSFLLALPDVAAREEVFRVTLMKKRHGAKSGRKTDGSSSSVEEGFDFHRCAQLTQGYSPSDIVSLCKMTARQVMYDDNTSSETTTSIGNSSTGGADRKRRPISNSDVEKALQTFYPTTWVSSSYGTLDSTAMNHYNGDSSSSSSSSNDDDDDE